MRKIFFVALLAILPTSGCKNDCQKRCEDSFEQAKRQCKAYVASSASSMAGVPGMAEAARGVSDQCESQAEMMKGSCEAACK